MQSILIIGMGTLGRHLAARMQQLGNEVMIVDKNEELIQELSQDFPDAYVGDCCSEGVLRSLGINNFDYCFVTVGDNFYESLEISASLKELGAPYVVCKAKQERQADFLKKIGADEVFFPEREIAEKLAVRYTSNNIFDFIELTGEYSIYEIPILPEWVGKSIIEINVRRLHRINIIAIKQGTVLNPSPDGNYIFQKDDHLVVIGKGEDVFRLSARAR